MTGEQNGETREDRLREAAVLVALRTGLLKRCPIHGGVYDPGQHDYQGALMVAAYLFNQSDPLVAPFDGDRPLLTELLKSICQSYVRGCPVCLPPQGDSLVIPPATRRDRGNT